MARRLNRQKKASKNALRSDGKGSSACTARKYVHNLSQYTINDFEYTLLAKRLKFIPASRVNNAKRMVINDFDEFARKIRYSYHYSTGDDYTIHPFRKSWVISPPKTCNALEEYIDKTKLELTSLQMYRFRDNLSKEEIGALSSLKDNKNIVIEKTLTKAAQKL